MGFLDRLNIQSFDAFPRTENDYRVRTKSGAIISLIALSIMTILFITELKLYLTSDTIPELSVDTTLGDPIQINIDITFPSLPCAFLSINAMDKTGAHQLNIQDHIFLTRLSPDGSPLGIAAAKEVVGEDHSAADIDLSQAGARATTCGNCYGAETTEAPCCNTCAEVQEAYRRKGWAFTRPQSIEQCVKEGYMEALSNQKHEGCHVKGYLMVSRVAGNFNIVPGKFLMQNARYVLDTNMFESQGVFNLTHQVHQLSFGLEYPGMKNPLDGVTKVWPDPESAAMYEYFVKVVPTKYQDSFGNRISSNQYSVTEYTQAVKLHSFSQSGLPGLFFMYEISPILVDYQVSSKSFLHFITNLCAIIGGVFTVASLIDAFIHSGIRALKKKIALGKHH